MIPRKIITLGAALTAGAIVQPALGALDAFAEMGTTQQSGAEQGANELATATAAEQVPLNRPTNDDERQSAVIAGVEKALAALPADATQADIEAAISYTIDQAEVAPAIAILALMQMISSYQPGTSTALAINTVLNAKKRLATGTGAIDDLFGEGFGPVPPNVTGGSDYG